LRYDDLTISNMAILNFFKFRVYVKWPVSPCCSVSPRKISLKSNNRLLTVLSYGQKRFLKWWLRHIKFLKFRIWSRDCYRVPNLLLSFYLCWYSRWIKLCTKFVAICRFSGWRMSAILNYREPIMGSLKSPCRTSYRSSIVTIARNCLAFEKNRVLCTHFGIRLRDKQSNRWTGSSRKAVLAIASSGLITRRSTVVR